MNSHDWIQLVQTAGDYVLGGLFSHDPRKEEALHTLVAVCNSILQTSSDYKSDNRDQIDELKVKHLPQHLPPPIFFCRNVLLCRNICCQHLLCICRHICRQHLFLCRNICRHPASSADTSADSIYSYVATSAGTQLPLPTHLPPTTSADTQLHLPTHLPTICILMSQHLPPWQLKSFSSPNNAGQGRRSHRAVRERPAKDRAPCNAARPPPCTRLHVSVEFGPELLVFLRGTLHGLHHPVHPQPGSRCGEHHDCLLPPTPCPGFPSSIDLRYYGEIITNRCTFALRQHAVY